MSDAPRMLVFLETECPSGWVRIPRDRRPKHWDTFDDPMVPLERNLYGHALARLPWERRLEEVLLQEGLEKYPAGNVFLFTDKPNSFFTSKRRRQKKVG